MTKPCSTIPTLFPALLGSACAGIGDINLGPDPGSGFYDADNSNVGHISPRRTDYFTAGDPMPWLQ